MLSLHQSGQLNDSVNACLRLAWTNFGDAKTKCGPTLVRSLTTFLRFSELCSAMNLSKRVWKKTRQRWDVEIVATSEVVRRVWFLGVRGKWTSRLRSGYIILRSDCWRRYCIFLVKMKISEKEIPNLTTLLVQNCSISDNSYCCCCDILLLLRTDRRIDGRTERAVTWSRLAAVMRFLHRSIRYWKLDFELFCS